MKVCPFCQKKIRDDARFCLSCMHSLSERQVLPGNFKTFGKKNKRPLLEENSGGVLSVRLGTIGLVVMSIIAGFLFLPQKDTSFAEKDPQTEVFLETKNEEENSFTRKSSTSHFFMHTEDKKEEIPSSSENEEEKKEEAKTSSTVSNTSTTTNKKNGSSTTSTTKKKTSSTTTTTKKKTSSTTTTTKKKTSSTTTTTKKKTSSTTTTTKKKTSSTTTTKAPTTTTAPPVTERVAEVYTYRAAKASDVDTSLPANCITITGLKSQSSDGVYNIPSSIDGKRVIAIADSAFQHTYFSPNNMREVTIPSSVTTIGCEAFLDCNLQSLTISEGVVSLRFDAFWASFRNLKTLRIPDSVTQFGGQTFWSCTGLENLYAGKNTVSTLGFCDEASYYPIPIKNVYLTNLKLWLNSLPYERWENTPVVGTLMENLYLNGKLVTDLVIPEGVPYIGQDSFSICTSIKTVTVPKETQIHPDAFHSNVTIIRV